MAKNDKNYDSSFLKYMEMIASHPNYKGLPIERKNDGSLKWVVTAKSKTGQKRTKWANELGWPVHAGVYADVMLEIHPTKRKVCQICGEKISLYYYYPNLNFLKSLNKSFNCNFTICDNINDIWDKLANQNIKKEDLAKFLISKGNLNLDYKTAKKDEIIKKLEYACRKGGKKCLGPGAMSNFPDRYDGFIH